MVEAHKIHELSLFLGYPHILSPHGGVAHGDVAHDEDDGAPI